MAKTYLPAGGGLTFKPILRFVGPLPLDGRGVVDSLSDISGQAYKTTFGGSEFEDVASYYEGMLVVTKDTGKLYVLNEGTFKEVTPDLSDIQGTLDAIPNTYVPKTLTINGKALNGNITLSATDIGLGDVTNLAAKDYFTALTSNTTNAIQITVGGTTKEIKIDTLKASLGLGSLAYRNSLSFQDVGALSATGTAVKAQALALTQAVGDTKTPVYFNVEGKPVALGYTIETSVPANAVFTDTTYSNENGITLNSGKFGLNLNSTTSLGTIGKDKVYAVGLDSNNKVAVKVDWTDEKVNVSNLGPTAPSSTKHYVTTAQGAGNSSLDIINDSKQGVYVERKSNTCVLVSPEFKGALKGNADTATEATTATNLKNAPTIQSDTSDNTKITITAGGKTSDSFTVPYASQALRSVTDEIELHIGQTAGENIGEIFTQNCNIPTVTATHIIPISNIRLPEGNLTIGITPVEASEIYEIINIKSNGFIIPGNKISGGWESSVVLAAGTIENVEVTIQHI